MHQLSYTTSHLILSKYRNIFLLTCTSLAIYYYWMQLEYKPYDAINNYVKDLVQKSRKNINNFRYSKSDKRNINLIDSTTKSLENNTNDFRYLKFVEKYRKAKGSVKTAKENITTAIYYSKVDQNNVVLKELKQESLRNTTEYFQYSKNHKDNDGVRDFIKESRKLTTKDFQHSKVAKSHKKLTNFIQESLGNTTKGFWKLKDEQKVNKDLKYILLWTAYDYAPFYWFGRGQKAFIRNNCSDTNCYVTTNRQFFKDDITKFHAVAFNGRTMSPESLPERRSPHQKYIYFNLESADNYPICQKEFDGFFNWTATYKLNSDILYPYIVIKNKEGDIIGPQINMRWPQNFPEVNGNFSAKLRKKTKAAAWFVSNCFTRNHRDVVVKELQNALMRYGLSVDIYGSCGPNKCPKGSDNICNSFLEKHYYFYMSLENTFAEDYVTEKLLKALQHDTVPIVYGGANYSRFLPPGSYIDSKEMNPKSLATLMDYLIRVPEQYSKFFQWKSQFTYSDPFAKENVCAVCAAMNNNVKFETVTVYDQLRKWWNPDYENRCRSTGADKKKKKKKRQMEHWGRPAQ